MGNDPSAGLVAIFAVLALALVVRWVFQPSRKHPIVRPVDASSSAELGLLTVVVPGAPREEAMRCRAVLGEANLRSSMSRRRDGLFDVLVFHADVGTARKLLGT